MTHNATLTYTKSLIHRAVLAYWWRSVGIGFVMAMLFVALSLAYYLGNGDRSWVVGVIASVLALGLALAAMLYVVHRRNAFARLRALGNDPVTLYIDDVSFTITSAAGSSTLPWRAITGVQQYPEFWLIYFSKAHFMTLPLASLPPAMRTTILERLAINGVKP